MPSSLISHFVGLAGDGLALGVVGHETLKQVAQDVSFLNGRGLVGVEGLRLAGIAAVIDDFGRGGAHEGGRGDGRESRAFEPMTCDAFPSLFSFPW